MYYRPNCPDGGNWAKKGWWRIDPGACKVVYGGSLRSLNRYYCYYSNPKSIVKYLASPMYPLNK